MHEHYGVIFPVQTGLGKGDTTPTMIFVLDGQKRVRYLPDWQHEKWISRRFLAGKTVSPLRLVPDSGSTDKRICSINVSGRLFVFRKGGISFASRTPSNHLTACCFENVFSWRIDVGRGKKRVLRIDADEYFEMRRFLGE